MYEVVLSMEMDVHANKPCAAIQTTVTHRSSPNIIYYIQCLIWIALLLELSIVGLLDLVLRMK